MNSWLKWEPELSRAQVHEKYKAGIEHGAKLGGLYTASLYFCLHSLLEHGGFNMQGRNDANHIDANHDAAGKKKLKSVLMFSYGSGSTATMMQAKITSLPPHFEPIGELLEKRVCVRDKALMDRVLKRHADYKKAIGEDLPEAMPELPESGCHGRFVLEKFPEGTEMRRYRFVE
jgi:hypothetical protein